MKHYTMLYRCWRQILAKSPLDSDGGYKQASNPEGQEARREEKSIKRSDMVGPQVATWQEKECLTEGMCERAGVSSCVKLI